MKKNGFLWVVLLLVVLLGVVYFAWKNIDTLKSEISATVVETSELRVMDLEKSKIDFSPLVSAILYSHISEEDLPLTLSFKTICPPDFLGADTLWAGFEHAGVRLVAPVGTTILNETGESLLCEMTMIYEVSELKQQMSDMEIMEFLKSMPNHIRKENVFLGSSDKKEVFEEKGWQPLTAKENMAK
jgi:hypothetical protein